MSQLKLITRPTVTFELLFLLLYLKWELGVNVVTYA